MSLGPPGLRLEPEQTENFEDVSPSRGELPDWTNRVLDGETIRRQRSAAQHAKWPHGFLRDVQSQVFPLNTRLQQPCNT